MQSDVRCRWGISRVMLSYTAKLTRDDFHSRRHTAEMGNMGRFPLKRWSRIVTGVGTIKKKLTDTALSVKHRSKFLVLNLEPMTSD